MRENAKYEHQGQGTGKMSNNKKNTKEIRVGRSISKEEAK